MTEFGRRALVDCIPRQNEGKLRKFCSDYFWLMEPIYHVKILYL